VIYKHEEPWWNDVNRGNLLIHPPELWQSLVAKQEELVKEMMNCPTVTCHKTLQHGANSFTVTLNEDVM
jgi:hypothetical protein